MNVWTAQTEIMKWLRSLGHKCIEDDKEMRSCTMKKRYDLCPSVHLDMIAYPCEYCGGWHKATKRS